MNEYITEYNNNIFYKNKISNNKNKKEKINKKIDILNYDIDNKEFIIQSNNKNDIFKYNKKNNEDNLILDNLLSKNEIKNNKIEVWVII